ncbi:MAG: hypothetical protein CL678_06845 [Bdellovibrionaceae bacterium]|nr:hypothetical protein [Pseudobdellovibrionaceae bacterium]
MFGSLSSFFTIFCFFISVNSSMAISPQAVENHLFTGSEFEALDQDIQKMFQHLNLSRLLPLEFAGLLREEVDYIKRLKDYVSEKKRGLDIEPPIPLRGIFLSYFSPYKDYNLEFIERVNVDDSIEVIERKMGRFVFFIFLQIEAYSRKYSQSKGVIYSRLYTVAALFGSFGLAVSLQNEESLMLAQAVVLCSMVQACKHAYVMPNLEQLKILRPPFHHTLIRLQRRKWFNYWKQLMAERGFEGLPLEFPAIEDFDKVSQCALRFL